MLGAGRRDNQVKTNSCWQQPALICTFAGQGSRSWMCSFVDGKCAASVLNFWDFELFCTNLDVIKLGFQSVQGWGLRAQSSSGVNHSADVTGSSTNLRKMFRFCGYPEVSLSPCGYRHWAC